MKVQNTQHFENFSLIQNNPSGASRHLPLHKGGFDFCETTQNRFIDTLTAAAYSCGCSLFSVSFYFGEVRKSCFYFVFFLPEICGTRPIISATIAVIMISGIM